MNTAGIDMGAKTIKALVLRDGEVVGRAMKLGGFETALSAGEVMAEALQKAGVSRSDISLVVATGAGRDDAPDKDRTMTEVSASARGAVRLFPEARTVIDVGAEEGRAIRCDERAKVVDFAINEKCAAGAGAFTEAMARALEVPIEELGPLSLKSTQAIPMNAQCAVFAESEVVSMIHNNVAKTDMARAVHDAIASRIISMVRKVGYTPPVVLIGGMAHNVGFVDSLKRGLEIENLDVPDEPEFCAALGAALAAMDDSRGSETT
jgi:benzoyl-CoA reductase subunit D